MGKAWLPAIVWDIRIFPIAISVFSVHTPRIMDDDDIMSRLLSDIEAFCATSGMSETAFGWAAVRDRSLVSDLRDGREPRKKTRERIRSFIENNAAA